ncbi:MAG: FeoA family protein [Anaerovoracaceae bacterium]
MKNKKITLAALPNGCQAKVNEIAAYGLEKDRLIDLGFAPGSTVKVLFTSPAKNPTAYEVMGAVLALREEDGKKIIVTPICSLEY